MNMKRFALILLFCLYGCVTTQPQVQKGLDQEIKDETIELLPVVDARGSKKEWRVNAPVLIKETKEIFTFKGYNISVSNGFKEGESLSHNQVSNMYANELSELGSKESKFLLLIYVEDAKSQYAVLAQSYRMKLRAVIVDKEECRYLWKNFEELDEAALGIIEAAFAKGMGSDGYAAYGLEQLFKTVPENY